MHNANEIAAAILLQTVVNHHPQLQAEIREQRPEPEEMSEVLIPYYAAILARLNAAGTAHVPESARATGSV